jgi:hypothetical protein
MDSFGAFRTQMHAALADYAAHATRAKQIRGRQQAEVDHERAVRPQVVGGFDQDPEYELAKKLRDLPQYGLVAGDRDAARWQSIMWGIAAMVEALAIILDDSPP